MSTLQRDSALPTGNTTRGMRRLGDLSLGLGFLAPNILGFLSFTLIPLIYSLVLAFSNWDLRLHNIFHPENHIRFVGFANFERLLSDADFWKYLGNTLFMMMATPVGIALSLMAAILLSRDLRGGSNKAWVALMATAVFAGSVAIFCVYSTGNRGMLMLLLGMSVAIVVSGAVGGSTVYRTLFYLPNFTAGVATMLLWKKLFQPNEGVINTLLQTPLEKLTHLVRASRAWEVQMGTWLLLLLAVLALAFAAVRLRRFWSDSDIGTGSLIIGMAFTLLPIVLAHRWLPAMPWSTTVLAGGSLLAIGWQLAVVAQGRELAVPRMMEGIGSALVLGATMMVVEFVCIGLSMAVWNLPQMAAVGDGLTPPGWMQSTTWVKPGLMLMGLWGAMGSGNMLLYLAALTNVPPELYEAADIDGAGNIAKFWNVTWPQLAPTTFFIVVMSVIGGLQSGFDQARVMTGGGGPAGASTTLSYMIYSEGFETGRFGYSAGAAWTLFLLVLIVTAFNWQFGNKLVNE